MMDSLVDYVLERGNLDYGEFAPKQQLKEDASIFSHKKLLAYLFTDNLPSQDFQTPQSRRISDMKIEQISGQLNYLSEKIHAELSKKYLTMDGDLYRLQNQWNKKKIPDFHCYYYLKFTYANSYSRMHQLILAELQNMSRQKDSYHVIKKTIEAREVCLNNLKKQINSITELDVQQSLQTLKQQRMYQKQKKIEKQQKGKKRSIEKEQQVGKSWKNKLQLVFQSISHFRKLTCYVVELIKNWKSAIYNVSEDPRRFRQRVIFYHNDANYLLKMLFDGLFVKNTFLNKYLQFGNHYDPFFLKPLMLLENKKNKAEQQYIFYDLIKVTQPQMAKIIHALVIIAEEEYDENQQSRFISERKDFGTLQQRKKLIEIKRNAIGLSEKNRSQSQVKLNKEVKSQRKTQRNSSGLSKQKQAIIQKKASVEDFSQNKKSDLTKKQMQQIKVQKQQSEKKTKVQSAYKRVHKIRSVDLKKVSPYLSRNERMQKAQKVLQLQYKFKIAQANYADHLKKKKQEVVKEHGKPNWAQQNKDVVNNRIFNKYIEQNLKIMDQANRKAYLYKNKVSPAKQAQVSQDVNYNKIPFRDRKEAEYQRNLQRFSKPKTNEEKARKTSGMFNKGTKAIIEISNKGIKSSEGIFEYQLTGKKGKNLGQILEKDTKNKQKNSIEGRLSRVKGKQQIQKEKEDQIAREQQKAKLNLFESQKANQIIIMRQQPEKIEQIKQFLYAKIKEQLIEQMKKNAQQREDDLNNMVQQQKRRKLQEIIQQRKLEQQRRKEQQERMRLAQLERQRKKINFQVRIEPIQYAQENLNQYFEKIFSIHTGTYQRLFTNQQLQDIKHSVLNQVHFIFLKGYYQNQQVGQCILHYDHTNQQSRSFVVDYLALTQQYLYISTFHQICQYLWNNDPAEQISIMMYKNEQNIEGNKVIQDVKQYAVRHGEIFQRRLYSNIIQYTFIWTRPQIYRNIEFPYNNFYFGRKMNFKAELLSAVISFNERNAPKIDMNLQTYTNYIFLLQELFRCYLTPEQVVELRENSTNIRRLKDIFRIVLQLEKSNPKVDELTVVQGLNLDDLYTKMKEKVKPPYDKYFWQNFYDKTSSNRVLLSILQTKLDVEFPINSCHLDDRRFMRINPRRKVLVLKSSVYSKENIYILNTNNPKIRIFLMQGEAYKLMRIQLFIFLNLVFNNIVEDLQKFVNSFWVPQFAINCEAGKVVKRITDFSISMKKSFFLSQQIYFCNHEYIKHGASLLPKASDIIFKQSVIFGFLHTDVEKGSTGMPLYAKLIDRDQMF